MPPPAAHPRRDRRPPARRTPHAGHRDEAEGREMVRVDPPRHALRIQTSARFSGRPGDCHGGGCGPRAAAAAVVVDESFMTSSSGRPTRRPHSAMRSGSETGSSAPRPGGAADWYNCAENQSPAPRSSDDHLPSDSRPRPAPCRRYADCRAFRRGRHPRRPPGQRFGPGPPRTRTSSSIPSCTRAAVQIRRPAPRRQVTAIAGVRQQPCTFYQGASGGGV